jgi:hypothetical protein
MSEGMSAGERARTEAEDNMVAANAKTGRLTIIMSDFASHPKSLRNPQREVRRGQEEGIQSQIERVLTYEPEMRAISTHLDIYPEISRRSLPLAGGDEKSVF